MSRATEYRFVLADNVTLASPIVDLKVKNAGFAMLEELDYGKTYYWTVKPVEPIEGNWSVLANFTVKEKPVELLPPLVVQQVPPPVINIPAAPPPTPKIVISPPLAPPAPTTPAYIWAIIIIGVALSIAVITLMFRPFRIPEVRGDTVNKLREALAYYFKKVGFFRLASLQGEKARTFENAQSISFAVKSFMWMLTPEEKGAGTRIMSENEEQKLGQTIASRIQNMAADQLIYKKFPEDAASFLYLWSRYGSRDETNLYLNRSFQSNVGNVIEFLKCYLPTSEGLGPGNFSRTQYDAVAKVVDPDNVFEALRKIYGPRLDKPESGEPGGFIEKAIAYQFARIHHSVKGKRKKEAADILASSPRP